MIKSVKTANKIIIKVFYSASSINEAIVAQNINEILLNENYSLSIKADDMYASILLSFDISSQVLYDHKKRESRCCDSLFYWNVSAKLYSVPKKDD